MLSAIFLAAVSAATARAQDIPAKDTTKVNDSTASTNDSTMVNYNDSSASYDPNNVYTEPAPPHYGFFSFHWVFHWRNYRHYHHHHPANEHYAPRSGPRVATQTNGLRTTAPTNSGQSPVAVNRPRTQGFGNTMHKSHGSAHS